MVTPGLGRCQAWCLIMFVLEVAMVCDDVCIGCHFRKSVDRAISHNQLPF